MAPQPDVEAEVPQSVRSSTIARRLDTVVRVSVSTLTSLASGQWLSDRSAFQTSCAVSRSPLAGVAVSLSAGGSIHRREVAKSSSTRDATEISTTSPRIRSAPSFVHPLEVRHATC